MSAHPYCVDMDCAVCRARDVADQARVRRERIATTVLAGIAGAHRKGLGLYSWDEGAKYAIRYADALIAALDAPQPGVGSTP